jgi:hypothetical protein
LANRSENGEDGKGWKWNWLQFAYGQKMGEDEDIYLVISLDKWMT